MAKFLCKLPDMPAFVWQEWAKAFGNCRAWSHDEAVRAAITLHDLVWC